MVMMAGSQVMEAHQAVMPANGQPGTVLTKQRFGEDKDRVKTGLGAGKVRLFDGDHNLEYNSSLLA